MKTGLGLKIKLARTEVGLTQEALGKKIKTVHAVIANWENGKFMPNQKSLKKLSEALNKPMQYFFNSLYEDKKFPPQQTKEDALAYSANTSNLPLLANTPGTLPEFKQENILGAIGVPRFLFPAGKFVIQAKSDLKPYIFNGDYCIIHATNSVENEKIVLVKVGDKFSFYKMFNAKNGQVKLDVRNGKEYKIIGEVVGILRKFE